MWLARYPVIFYKSLKMQLLVLFQQAKQYLHPKQINTNSNLEEKGRLMYVSEAHLEKTVNYFRKKPHHRCLGRVLSTPLVCSADFTVYFDHIEYPSRHLPVQIQR